MADLNNLIGTLQCCRARKDITGARKIYTFLCCDGLDALRHVGNQIVCIFVECGSLVDAQHAFSKLSYHTGISWNSLIAAYLENEKFEHAFQLYWKMKEAGVRPNSFTLVPLLKVCGTLQDVERGREMHEDIWRGGLQEVAVVGNSLISMYSKCGSLIEAREVFDKLSCKNVVSWNTLIAGYVEGGHPLDALDCFKQMQLDSFSPDDTTFAGIVKACGDLEEVDLIRLVHTKIAYSGFERNSLVGNTLVDVYAKCGLLCEASEAFNHICDLTVVSWNALIAGYAEHDTDHKALDCFTQMLSEGMSPSVVTFICLLKAKWTEAFTDRGVMLHMHILMHGFEGDLLVGSGLVNMYAECGLILDAESSFHKLPVKGVVAWTSLMAGYTTHGLSDKTLACFEDMQSQGVCVDSFAYSSILKGCETLLKSRQLFSDIVCKGLEKDVFVSNTLVDTYARCGLLSEAVEINFNLSKRTVVSWNALITAFSEYELVEEAFKSFEKMKQDSVIPNTITYVSMFKLCGCSEEFNKGRELHNEVCQIGLQNELCVGNSILSMYSKCAAMFEARKVFDSLLFYDVASWNTLIAGYAEQGHGQEALECFDEMTLREIPLDDITCTSLLKVYADLKALEQGRAIHMDIIKRGLPLDEVVFSMYAKCGSLLDAQKMLENMAVKDVVSWTELIVGYVKHGVSEEMLRYFEEMQVMGISPDAVMFASLVNACGSVGSLEKGQDLHKEISRTGMQNDLVVGNCLVDMYGKCGSLAEAQEVFNGMLARDVVSWTVLISAYAMHNEEKVAIWYFENMMEQGVEPNAATFTCLLAACSHAGLVLQGQAYFKTMNSQYDITPSVYHHTCMVDMFARSGCLSEAWKLHKAVPFSVCKEIWSTMLGSCKIYGETDLGLGCFEHLVQMSPEAAASYVLFSHMCQSNLPFITSCKGW